jgi:hypothetical protein
MYSIYDPEFYIYCTSVRLSYVAVKVSEPILPHGVFVLKLLALAALLR